jgi:CubicO group peptidase (beta-lactamase class C family)
MSSTTEAGKAGIPGVHLTGDQIIQETTLQYLKALQDEWGIPGVSLAIVRMNEDKQWDKQTIGMGRKDVDGDRLWFWFCQTLFSIASNSKLFTAISTGLVLSESNSSWDTPVQKVIPLFQLMDKEAEERATFIELLSHQTGLPRHGLSYE